MAQRLNVVTGAAGLLGSHVVEQLVARGERVRALVRPSSDATFLRQLGVEVVPCDLSNAAACREAVAGADTAYHCAAKVGDWGTWQSFRRDVIDVTRHVMESCRAAAVGRILHVSSVAVYGHPRVPPGGITEEHALGQRLRLWDHYARAKIQAEEVVRAICPEATIIRPTWIFGPRDRRGLPHLIDALRGNWVKIVGAGDNLLNIVHAADIAAGAILAANHPGGRGQAYHLCSEGEITQRQFLDTLTDAVGLPRVAKQVSMPMASIGGLLADIIARACRWGRAPYVSRYSISMVTRPVVFRIDKARSHFGWSPRIKVVEGLREAAACWRESQRAPCGSSM